MVQMTEYDLFLLQIETALLAGLCLAKETTTELLYRRSLTDGQVWMIRHTRCNQTDDPLRSPTRSSQNTTVFNICGQKFTIEDQRVLGLPDDWNRKQDLQTLLKQIAQKMEGFLAEGNRPDCFFWEKEPGDREKLLDASHALALLTPAQLGDLRRALVCGLKRHLTEKKRVYYLRHLSCGSGFRVDLSRDPFSIKLLILGHEYCFFDLSLSSLPELPPTEVHQFLRTLIKRAQEFSKKHEGPWALSLSIYPLSWKSSLRKAFWRSIFMSIYRNLVWFFIGGSIIAAFLWRVIH